VLGKTSRSTTQSSPPGATPSPLQSAFLLPLMTMRDKQLHLDVGDATTVDLLRIAIYGLTHDGPVEDSPCSRPGRGGARILRRAGLLLTIASFYFGAAELGWLPAAVGPFGVQTPPHGCTLLTHTNPPTRP